MVWPVIGEWRHQDGWQNSCIVRLRVKVRFRVKFRVRGRVTHRTAIPLLDRVVVKGKRTVELCTFSVATQFMIVPAAVRGKRRAPKSTSPAHQSNRECKILHA
jgi:hypothetical protein